FQKSLRSSSVMGITASGRALWPLCPLVWPFTFPAGFQSEVSRRARAGAFAGLAAGALAGAAKERLAAAAAERVGRADAEGAREPLAPRTRATSTVTMSLSSRAWANISSLA